MPFKLPDITIIRDSREKENNGWFWVPEEKEVGKIRVAETIEQGLGAGDYTLKGYEDKIVIERKAGICELFGNMTPVAHRERFEREMEKLRNIPYKYLIIEDHLTNDMLGMSIPQFYKSPPGSAVIRWIYKLQMEYQIVPIFAGSCGKKMARYLFENFIRYCK